MLLDQSLTMREEERERELRGFFFAKIFQSESQWEGRTIGKLSKTSFIS